MMFFTMKLNSIQFNSIQFNSIQFNSIQFNSIQFNSIRLCRGRRGIVVIVQEGGERRSLPWSPWSPRREGEQRRCRALTRYHHNVCAVVAVVSWSSCRRAESSTAYAKFAMMFFQFNSIQFNNQIKSKSK